jgi:hypothetical protein
VRYQFWTFDKALPLKKISCSSSLSSIQLLFNKSAFFAFFSDSKTLFLGKKSVLVASLSLLFAFLVKKGLAQTPK